MAGGLKGLHILIHDSMLEQLIEQRYTAPKEMVGILNAIGEERKRQDAKFGAGISYPEVSPELVDYMGAREHAAAAAEMAKNIKAVVDHRVNNGSVSWSDILSEEVAEVLEAAAAVPGFGRRAEGLSEELEIELIQVAAVAVAWIQDIHRRRGAKA